MKGTYSETQVVAGSGCTNDGGVINGCVVDLSGLPLLQLPKKQLNISATQRVPLGAGDLAVTGAFAYVGAQHFNAVRAADQQSQAAKIAYARENELGRISGYGVFNGRISYTFDEPNLELALYGRNIFNNKYLVRRFSDLYGQLGISAAYVGEPVTYGIEATLRFRSAEASAGLKGRRRCRLPLFLPETPSRPLLRCPLTRAEERHGTV